MHTIKRILSFLSGEFGGFNPRLAPYTLNGNAVFRNSSKDAAVAQHVPIFKFPFAGQLVGAYANARRVSGTAAAADAGIEATTATGVDGIAMWKYATADTTATYASGLRAAKRTGNADTSTGGGINFRLPTVSGTPGLYTLTNQTAARRTFAAGDVVMLMYDPRGATDAHRLTQVDYQMDYIIGYEDGTVASAGTGPA